VIQACGSCHNDVLDQTLSRARFNIALSRMDRAELDLAIARIQQPGSAPGAMPPPGTRQLDPEAKRDLVAYLRRSTRPAEDDARLARAAALGMVGNNP
jgi:cytochrome c553